MVRQDFRDSAAWVADLQTDSAGLARCTVILPDALTEWRGRVVAWTRTTEVGEVEFRLHTTKDLQARLVLPRSTVEGDAFEVRVIASDVAGLERAGRWSLSCADAGVQIHPIDVQEFSLPALGTHTVRARVHLSGADGSSPAGGPNARTATFVARVWAAQAGADDALQGPLEVQADGAFVRQRLSARLSGNADQTLRFTPPWPHRAGSVELSVEVRPTLLLQLWDTLPFLLDYPYECVEQTVSRFVPALAVRDALQHAGCTLGQLAESARAVPRLPEVQEPRVLSQRELERVIVQCTHNLRAAQNSDGGFGWWKDDPSSSRMTTYVLRGLEAAERSGCAGLTRMRARAAAWLEAHAARIADPCEAAAVALALAGSQRCPMVLLDQLLRVRSELPSRGLANLISALARSGRPSDAQLALAQLAERAITDESTGTAWWPAMGAEWAWWNARIEVAAAGLTAFMDANPDHALVAPLTRWMVMNRRGQGWSNTRDTAEAITALTRVARRDGELDPDLEVTCVLGTDSRHLTLRSSTMLMPQRLVFTSSSAGAVSTANPAQGPEALTLQVHSKGRGVAYVSAILSAVATGDAIAAQSSGIRVERTVHTVRADGSRGAAIEPVTALEAAQLVEIDLQLTVPNDFEYVQVEDPRAAGFEPELRTSGWVSAEGMRFRQEVRSDRTAFFITHLQQGTHHLRYRVRAETPGSVKALPAHAVAMYATEFRGNSSARRFEVRGP